MKPSVNQSTTAANGKSYTPYVHSTQYAGFCGGGCPVLAGPCVAFFCCSLDPSSLPLYPGGLSSTGSLAGSDASSAQERLE